VLKARSALLAVESVVRTAPHPGTRQLAVELERAWAGAHELAELRVAAALRSGRTSLPAGLGEDALRLVGTHGTGIPARLGIGENCTAAEAWAVATDTLGRWQEEAENPLYQQDQRRAATVVVRTCEGLLTDLAQEVPVA